MDFRWYKYALQAEVRKKTIAGYALNSVGDTFGAEMKAEFEAGSAEAGWCKKNNPKGPLNIRSMCGSKKKNGIWKLDFSIFVSKKGYYELPILGDFVGGVAAYADGVLIYAQNWDHYGNWGNTNMQWNHEKAVVRKTSFNFEKNSYNKVTIYGLATGSYDYHFDY